MKNIVLFSLVVLIGFRATGQNQADPFIKEAQEFLAKKEYKQAQLSLQDALNAVNILIAQQVSESLPAEINGLKADGPGDVNTAAMGLIGGGMQISKKYRNETKVENEAEVQIIANSPTLSAMSMYLTNPSILGPDYKSVRVGTNRAILKSQMDDYSSGGADKKIRSSEIQIPLGQTLITITARGFATEQDELAFATKLNLEKLRAALGE